MTDRSQDLDTLGFRASVKRFSFVVRRVADVGDDRNLSLAHLGQRKQRCSLHFDRQHTFFAVLVQLLSSLAVRRVGRPYLSL
jgi:hypothetical protein